MNPGARVGEAGWGLGSGDIKALPPARPRHHKHASGQRTTGPRGLLPRLGDKGSWLRASRATAGGNSGLGTLLSPHGTPTSKSGASG